jgi:hypothetical protein
MVLWLLVLGLLAIAIAGGIVVSKFLFLIFVVALIVAIASQTGRRSSGRRSSV